MPKEIILPSLTADFESGVIEEWHKKVGDRIEVGDVIAEVSTDKAVVELEAPDAGVLGKILVPAGLDPTPVNTVIGVLLLDGESEDALDGFVPGGSGQQQEASVASIARDQDARASADEQDASMPEAGAAGDRVFASPVALRIASQLGVDLSLVEGSGPGGRIVLGDVEAAADSQGLATRPTPAKAQTEVRADMPPAGNYTEVPIDRVRRVIAQRLASAKREIPHFYLTIDCLVDELLEARRHLNADRPGDSKVSVNDFIVKACGLALNEVPDANAGWSDEAILRFNSVDISVAVASPKGLVTPVVRNADSRSLDAISTEIKELAGKARDGRLKPEEYKGGGFTLSNLGMYGIREFSAIINPPQACILAVGAAEPRAVVRDGLVTAASVMSCTLSVDHRVVDGALGAEFLQVFKKLIESPAVLLD